MSLNPKISPAFEPLLAHGGARDKCVAIVVYRTAGPPPDVRKRLRTLKARLDRVKGRAKERAPVQQRLFDDYGKVSRKHYGRQHAMTTAPIGGGNLPMALMHVTRKTLPDLAEQKEVVAIMPNQKIRLLEPKEVDYKALVKQEVNDHLTWGLKKLGIPEMWQHARGRGVNVAVLDTGVHGDHPALAGRVKDFVVVDPLGRVITTDPTFDSGQHGTHVCGTIAGGKSSDLVSIGVAPEANLLVAGVLIGEATIATLLKGIDWAVERDANIVSMSLGFDYYEPLFVEVFNALLELDIIPVVAIGNENHGNTSSPGSAHNALAVGALEKMKGGKYAVASFSSGASFDFPQAEPKQVTKPDVVAPGVQVYSAIPPQETSGGTFEYNYMGGSSMATPHVAGVIALLLEAKPTAPVADIIQALKDTAKHPNGDAYRPDNRWGYGLIRPKEALSAL